MIQQATEEELRNVMNILQEQGNDIGREATEAFGGIATQIQDMVKKQASHASTVFNYKNAILKIHDNFKGWKNSQQSIENKVKAMDRYIKQIPTQGDLQKHTKAMDEML
jgi:hypothetical protein